MATKINNVLLVEDDELTRNLLKAYLEKESFVVSSASDGQEMIALLDRDSFDLVFLDLNLPDEDGLSLARRLRSRSAVPLIVLTSRQSQQDPIAALEIGADDYVTKPFSPKALVARAKALLRRLERSPASESAHFRYGPLTMDLGRHEVRFGEKEVLLTAKEFGLLEHLLRNPGRVLTRDVLLNAVWGYDYFGTTRTVDVHIRRLKQKLPLLDEAIVSVKSLGYKLKEQ